MIESIRVVNSVTAKEVELKSGGNGMYVLDSIDWDTPSIEQETYRVPFQIGKTLEGVTVGTRKPTVTGYVIADTQGMNPTGKSWDEYLGEQKEQIDGNKQELDSVISIHQDVVIIVGEYRLVGRPTQPPKYSTDVTENNEVFCLFSLEFECYSPLFEKETRYIDFATTSDKMVFPMILTSDKTDEYAVFGEISKRKSILIDNSSDVDTGCIIRIKAVGGSVENPSVYNVQTGEKISFYDLTIPNGSSIIINTEIGKEDIVLHDSSGNEKSIVGQLTVESKLFKVLRGQYYYSYEVEEASKNNVEIVMEYSEKYYNIRGM